VRDTPPTICSGACLTGPLYVVVWIDLPAGNQDNLTSGPSLDWGGWSLDPSVPAQSGTSTSGQPFGPGDVVQGVVQIQTPSGQVVTAPAVQVTPVPPRADYMPWIVGGGALLLVVVLLMGRR